MKKEINKWQIEFSYSDDGGYLDRRVIRIGIFNFRSFPEVGAKITKDNYDGFLWIWEFRHPLSILRNYLEHKGY